MTTPEHERFADDPLAAMLAAQREFQASKFIDPAESYVEDRIEYIRYNVLALLDEVHEMLGEISWKPWQNATYINGDAALHEWIDAWHFMMNILWAIVGQGTLGDAGVLSLVVRDEYFKKRGINIQRQEDGYDGVSGKCQLCKRDFADTECTSEVCVHRDMGSARAAI